MTQVQIEALVRKSKKDRNPKPLQVTRIDDPLNANNNEIEKK